MIVSGVIRVWVNFQINHQKGFFYYVVTISNLRFLYILAAKKTL